MITHPLTIAIGILTVGSISAVPASEITYRKVVDTDDELPIVKGSWAGFYNPAISHGQVAFLAYQPAFSPLSLFAEFNGQIVHVASNGDPIPKDGRTILIGFTTVSFPVYHDGRIYWEVSLLDEVGSSAAVVEYSKEGLRVAFDEAMVNAYAGTSLSWYAYHDLSIGPGDRVARALSSPDGYLWLIGYNGAGISTINAGTSLPPSSTRFTQDYAVYGEGFAICQPNGSPKFLRDHLGTLQTLDPGLAQLVSPDVFFVTDAVYGNGRWFAVQGRLQRPGTSNFTTAILGWAAGKWFKVIREGDSAQDGTVITGLSDISAPRYSIDGDSLLFTAGTANGNALFLFRNGQVHRILSPGDFIDGCGIVSILIGRNSLQGDYFGIVTQFTNGKRAVYVGDLSGLYPAPTTSLRCQITLNGPHVGEVTAPTLENRVYHFLQSDDLQRWSVIRSVQGGSSMKSFTFDNSLEGPKRRFYRIDEAIYSR